MENTKMKTIRRFKLELYVEAPSITGEAEIINSLNAALDEPPCDWEDWMVSGAAVVGVELAEREIDECDEEWGYE